MRRMRCSPLLWNPTRMLSRLALLRRCTQAPFRTGRSCAGARRSLFPTVGQAQKMCQQPTALCKAKISSWNERGNKRKEQKRRGAVITLAHYCTRATVRKTTRLGYAWVQQREGQVVVVGRMHFNCAWMGTALGVLFSTEASSGDLTSQKRRKGPAAPTQLHRQTMVGWQPDSFTCCACCLQSSSGALCNMRRTMQTQREQWWDTYTHTRVQDVSSPSK